MTVTRPSSAVTTRSFLYSSMSETGSQYKLECSLHGHELDVRAVVALSNDLVVSAARDKTVRSWNRTQANDFEQQHTYLGHSHYVNALASLPPSPEHPKGLIVSSGSDKVINVYDVDRSDDPVYTLVGHTENVCSLAVTASGDIISGSWDKLAIVWKDFQQAYVLKGHEAAVWSVLSVDNDRVLTASADKTIKLWTNGKLTQTFSGHTDVVRDLAMIPGLGFVSCSNDSSLRIWSLSGETLMELSGHTSFVYSVSVLSTGEMVSSGEDRSVRIWKDGQCIQTIHQPCISVWCVNVLPNDDIIVGGSDGIVRLFTRSQERFADQETLKQFDDLVASHAIPSNQVGDVKKDDLPGTEALHVPGRKEGQVLMVRNGDVVEAHQWSSATGTWTKVGEVVDAVGSNRKQVYNGQEYDYVFDIDIGAGPDGMLKLPFNVTENPYDAAQKFIWKHELSQDFLDQIADFIIKNAKGVEIGMSNSAQYVDPYTGAARYTPETRAADANATYLDPFTGSSSYSTNSAAMAAEPKVLPQKSPLLFKQASLSAIHKKILSTNAEIDAALSQEDIEKLNEGVHYLQNPVANVSDDKHRGSISTILKIITTWPVELRFPGLDLIRLYALYQPSALLSSITDGDLESFFRTWANLNQLSQYTGGQKATDKTLETNYMLAVRTYANLFGTDIGSDYIKRQKQAIISLLLTDGSWKSFQTKNFRLALATLFLNFSVHLSKTSTDEEDELLLVQNIIEYLKEELDVENVYRAMVAVGTLLSQSSNAKEAAVVFDGPVVLQNVTRQQSDVRIRKVADEISKL
ncbi:hypothetical protein INT43_002255 [Umbelopsis isabellina]|uniref:Phospholipase A-2-activating protein n=1 Tax=Mortierella isabellina TaxID=91625 RepID=A0A8H7Q5U7_MORIS|nr:hypothetical protein INT43_002255 [Umbelopsis isabellina]